MTELEKTGGTMNCGVVAELLEAYHGGQLNSRALQSIDEHLAGCAACSVRLASLQRKSKASGEAAAISDGVAGQPSSAPGGDTDGSGRRGRGIPRLAVVAIALAAIIVPGSFWLANARDGEDHNLDAGAALVSLRRVGDDETRSAGFRLREPANVRVYAVGEGMDGEMYDYGWIVDAGSRQTVWSMEYFDTRPAGGDDKNRVIDDVISLPPGSYLVQYKTDGSHSYDDWNTDPPDDDKAWGITVSVARSGGRRAVAPRDRRPERRELAAAVETAREAAMAAARVAATEAVRSAREEVHREMRRAWSDVEVVAQIIGVGDDADISERFTLDRDSQVRIYAMGESMLGELYDYAWIEEADVGHTVWRMDYGMTEHAGGADKNRLVDIVLRLHAGEYVLRYRSDDSHSTDGWNSQAPPDAANYGVTLFREGRSN